MILQSRLPMKERQKAYFQWGQTSKFSSLHEQDKSSDIEQQPPFGDRKISHIQPPNRGGGLQN